MKVEEKTWTEQDGQVRRRNTKNRNEEETAKLWEMCICQPQRTYKKNKK